MHTSLVPSLPATSFEEIQNLLETLKNEILGIQIDIVDGVFAPYTSWPFASREGIEALSRLSPYTDLEIEIDAMCMTPEAYLDAFVQSGAKRVIIHAGSTEVYETCISHARAHGYRVGLGLRNDTEAQFCDTYIPQFDFVQVMGIRQIGVQGQPFDEVTIHTVMELRKKYPDLEIAVDGGVNAETIPQLLKAGANRFAPGSAITKASDPCVAYKQLLSLITP